jgi:hypothetical protein
MEHFWQGFKKQAGLKDVASKSWKAVSAPFRGAANIGKNVEKASKDVSHMSKLVGGSAVGAAGVYGASKAISAPKDYQEYKFYKRQNDLADKK